MKILHLLSGGGIGGIEVLCRDIADLSREEHEFCFLYDGGMIAEEMQKKKVPVYFLYKKNIAVRLLSLIKLVKDKRYNTVLVHHEGVGIYTFYLVLTCLFPKIKFVKYLHCSFEDKYFYQGNKVKDWLNYQALSMSLKRSEHMIAVSDFVKKSYCEEFQCDESKVSVIYNGIRIPERKESIVLKRTVEKLRLLYIGRLVEVKGIRVLLQAIKILQDKGLYVELDILGEGPQREEFEELSKEWTINDRVYFHGQQLQKQEYYDNADVFVYPSVWQEAFGISIVEAMAQGMICVASLSGGIPEIIEDGKDGFLFPIADAEALAGTIQRIMQLYNEQKEKTIMDAAKQKAREFDINKMIEKLQEVCR